MFRFEQLIQIMTSPTGSTILGHNAGIDNFVASLPQNTAENSFQIDDEQRQEFYRSLSNKLGRSGFGGNRSRSRSRERDNMDFETGPINKKGELTPWFRAQIQKEGDKVARDIQQVMEQDSHPPQRDLFGVARHRCEECEKDGNCLGYESADNMFSSQDNQRGEFPTFCRQCGCPAYFHEIMPGQNIMPPEISQIICSQNITAEDINWNCLFSAFLLVDGTRDRIKQAKDALADEGIEVISYSSRSLEPEEAFLLRNRIVNTIYSKFKSAKGSGVQNLNSHNDVKMRSRLSALEKDGQMNPYRLEIDSLQQEAEIQGRNPLQAESDLLNRRSISPIQRGGTNATLQPKSILKSTLNNTKKQVWFGDDSFQRASSPNVSGIGPNSQLREQQQQWSIEDVFIFESEIKEKLRPKKTKKLDFKIREQGKLKGKKSGNKAQEENKQLQLLLKSLKSNPMLIDMINPKNEVAFMILSSTRNQNINAAVPKILAKHFPPGLQGTTLLYTSSNKVEALEDCVHFVPHLFRLSKSIFVAEPVYQGTDVMGGLGKDSYMMKLQREITDKPSNLAQERQINPELQGKQVSTHYCERGGMSVQRKLAGFKKKIIEQLEEEEEERLRHEERENRGHDPDESDNWSEQSWVQRARKRKTNTQAKQKIRKMLRLQNVDERILYNYGIMKDFLNYSGMHVMKALRHVCLQRPPNPRGLYGIHERDSDDTQYVVQSGVQPCNMFAVSKAGLPNLIMPNTLDIKITNYEDFAIYSKFCDQYFPEMSKVSQTIIILRPLIVRNNLHTIFANILRQNEFVVVAQSIRNLKMSEINYLRKEENIPEENHALFHDLMEEGPSCIMLVSKIAGVQDAKAILNGATPFGRKRMNQPSEQGDNNKFAMSSVDAMFELSPFSSFLELFDLQDFLSRGQRLKNIQKEKQLKEYVYSQKQYNNQQINLFSRFFNFTGYCSKDLKTANYDVCWFMSSQASLDDIVLIMLPQYNNEIDHAFEMLVRQGYRVLQHASTQLSIDQIIELYGDRLSSSEYAKQTYNQRFFVIMQEQPVHVFHLQKVAADSEARSLWERADVQMDDLITRTTFPKPFKPTYIPYMFLFLDDLESREVGLALIYNVRHLVYSGIDLFNMGYGGKSYRMDKDNINSSLNLLEKYDKNFYTQKYKEIEHGSTQLGVQSFSKERAKQLSKFASIVNQTHDEFLLKNNDVYNILQYCLLVTVGEPIKVLENEFRGPGRVKRDVWTDPFTPLNIQHNGSNNEPLYRITRTHKDVAAKYCPFEVEAISSGVFEIRIHNIDDDHELGLDEYYEYEKNLVDPRKSRDLWNEEIMDDLLLSLKTDSILHRFASLNFYYKQASKVESSFVPSFYRYKLGSKLNRVFEVETDLGDPFMEGLAKLHLHHKKIDQVSNRLAQITASTCYSLPSYVMGTRLGKFCARLREIDCQIKGAGKFFYDKEKKDFVCKECPNITQSSYFEYDKARYLQMLEKFKQGFGHYISELEADIIVTKLNDILNSITFRWSRDPKFLRLVPERLAFDDIKISTKLKVIAKDSLKNNKFFNNYLEDGQQNPNEEIEASSKVPSLMKAQNEALDDQLKYAQAYCDAMIERTKLLAKKKEQETMYDGYINMMQSGHLPDSGLLNDPLKNFLQSYGQREYTVVNDICMSGFNCYIAKRPYFHMLGNLYWVFNFDYKKDKSTVNYFKPFFKEVGMADHHLDQEYEQIIDIVISQMLKEWYKNGEEEVLDTVKVVVNADEIKTEFEQKVDKQIKLNELASKKEKEDQKWDKVKSRSQMTIQELLQSEIGNSRKEEKKKEMEEYDKYIKKRQIDQKGQSEFEQHLAKQKGNLGPYALKMAEHFSNKIKNKEYSQANNKSEQEFINLIKMEYFLFGCKEAFEKIKLLQYLEDLCEDLQEDLEPLSAQLQNLENNYQTVNDQTAKIGLIQEQQRIRNALRPLEDRLQAYRHTIREHEKQLVQIWKELMAWNFRENDDYFTKKEAKNDHFTVGVDNYWLPVKIPDMDRRQKERELLERANVKKIGNVDTLTPDMVGQFLSAHLRSNMMKDKKNIEQIELERNGVRVALPKQAKEKEEIELRLKKYIIKGMERELDAQDQISKQTEEQQKRNLKFEKMAHHAQDYKEEEIDAREEIQRNKDEYQKYKAYNEYMR